jgi:cell division septation protein DedD
MSPPAPKVTIAPPLPEKDQYAILVGNYGKYLDAERTLARLKKQGKPAFIRPEPGKKKRYQVWQGPYPALQEAKAAAKSSRPPARKVCRFRE